MLKHVCLVIALLAFTVDSFAQKTAKESITGIVKTTDGYPSEFISVVLKNTSYGDITNAEGKFKIEAPEGDYTMVVYSIFAHRKEFPITVKAGTSNYFPDISIIENKNQLNEVVVTGQFTPQSLRNSIYKVRVINSQQIEQRAAINIQGVLNTEIGIRLSNDMALGETDFELMGMSGNNVKVLIDGVPVIDRLAAKQSLSQIDINTVDRIEIIEGPMSVIYGTDALAGVINVITKNGKLEDGKRLAVGARVQEESVGREYSFLTGEGNHNQSVNAQYTLDNGLYAGGSFTRNDFGGWQGDSTGRKKQWQPKEQYLLGGQLGYAKQNYNIAYRLDYLNENLLTEADVNPITNKTSDKEFIVNRYTHQLQGEWKASNNFSLSAAASYQDYTRRTRTTMIDLNTGKKELSLEAGAQDETNFNAWFGRVMGVWKVSNQLVLQPGVEFQSDEGTGDRIAGSHRINNTALFLSAEYTPVNWLSIRPGVRSSFNSAYDAPWAVPALNLKARVTGDIDLRLSYARGFRSPTLQELYYTFHDSNHHIDGNPDLKAEYSNSYMASVAWRSLHDGNIRLTTTLTGFYNDFRDRISLVESLTEVGANTYYNIDKFRTLGLTLENNFYWKSLRASLNVSYLGRYNSFYESEVYQDEEMDKFRYSPEVALNLTYDWAKVATFNVFYKFTGQRKEFMFDDNKKMGLLGLDSYNWADITVTRKIVKGLMGSGGVRNLFDITTIRNTSSGGAHSGGTGSSQLACGRSYFVGLTYNFQQ
ncbi:outer membrane receptor for ferrienterochelin and colicins [Dysgonomonas alginatilytica]|uniref:Outer membrane receptor for ferrienterochelin and colicins n=1 Tax=Dysgonomonas alginatilytica TaxID=1605892 RepID=A0A2V3PPY5_9BACT|nr:TonB-dependent receptor [Dysgonomonas alginatilytica]PXV63198.1 outer membrane receptor for ferrienterochelin and colicins [Dysgonomonas alginatilytica]